jgi:hypothetical protein
VVDVLIGVASDWVKVLVFMLTLRSGTVGLVLDEVDVCRGTLSQVFA